MIPDPNLSFSLTELKNDSFTVIFDRKQLIFSFSQNITPDVSTTFTSYTTFVCSPPLDFLSHALTENIRDALSTNRILVTENKNDRKTVIY